MLILYHMDPHSTLGAGVLILLHPDGEHGFEARASQSTAVVVEVVGVALVGHGVLGLLEIGRASCRERV